jgi:hypothetical protein
MIEGLEARQMLNIDPGSITATPLGTVEFMRLENVHPSADDVYYSAQAGRDGFFSLEANSANVELILHDADGNELATSTDKETTQRLDWEADQGDSFIVQISGTAGDVDLTLANLVTLVGDTVTVEGTLGDDQFVFSTGTTWRRVVIKELQYDFFNAEGTTVVFNAGAGDDTATLYDSAGDDAFEAGPSLATLSSDAYSVSVSGVENVFAYANEGGTDIAKLYDSPGDDTFVSTSDFGKLYGDGFLIRAKSFEFIHGYAKAGGSDRAKMFDSPGRDTFIGTPVYGKMSWDVKQTEYVARAKFFQTVKAYATEGTRDFAALYGSDGDDELTARRYQSDLTGTDSDGRDFSISIHDFFVTRAYDNSGGNDVATLYDTKYYETFEASPASGKLHGAKLYLLARGFDQVHAYSQFPGDEARFQDSPGDDLFVGKAEERVCKLSRDGSLFLRAEGFDKVYAESTAGGNDSANLGDSFANDLLKALDDWARISSTGGGIEYLYEVKGFDSVTATSSNGGTDTTDIDPGVTFVDLDGDWT